MKPMIDENTLPTLRRLRRMVLTDIKTKSQTRLSFPVYMTQPANFAKDWQE